MRLKNKVAIITGGGAGIGKAVSTLFSEEGARVAIWDLHGAEDTAAQIKAGGGTALALKVDISDKNAVHEALAKVVDAYNRVDILVNSAGICNTTSFQEMTEEEWSQVIKVNVWGTFCCCQAVVEEMKKHQSGSIINLTSQAAKTGGILVGMHYVASKAAIAAMTFSMAKLFVDSNIRVNAIAPGMVATDMIKGITKGDLHAYDDLIPMKRLGEPKEVACAALFLASGESSYITGEIIDVNGGQLMD
jgi:NAD(P)-dependent dehydrogenase (short-subunit alcohol dehydrogenase family)